MDPLVHGVLLLMSLTLLGIMGFVFMESDEGWKKWLGSAVVLFIVATLMTLIIFGGG